MALVWSRPERAADGWLRSCAVPLWAARRCPRPLSRAAPCGRMWRRHPMDAGWLGAGARTVIGHWCAGRWIRPMPPRCWSRPVAASPTWCGRPVGSSGSSPTPPGFRKRTAGAIRGGAGAAGGGGAQPLTNEPLGARAPAPLADGTLLYAALRARGWELRRVSALEGAPPVTFAKPLRFDPAPAVPISETGYTMWPSLRPHFWIPVFDDAGPTGRFGGPLTAAPAAPGAAPAP